MNLPIGESGHVLSRHYKDQWDAYYNATSFPMQFGKVDAKSVLEFVPEK
jgi:acyl-homoserine lactone acylase PvdQ